MNKITVTQTIEISASPDKVWDYTQNWKKRSEWDRSVVSAEYLMEAPEPSIQVKGAGGLSFNVTYKLSDRPHLTTLVMTNLNSFWLKGGGGSWKYVDKEGKTLWTQNNTLVLRDGVLGQLFRPLFTLVLATTTRQMMKRAKSNIEK